MLQHSKGITYWPHIILVAFVLLLAIPANAQERLSPGLRKKLSPNLENTYSSAPPRSVRVLVKDKAAFIKWMKEQQVQTKIVSETGNESLMEISELTPEALLKILQNPWTEYIDRANRVAKEELELRDADFTVNKVHALHSRNLNLTGSGMVVSIKENPFNPYDIDLKGRVLEPGSNGNSYSLHATTMATIIAGAGNSGSNGRGVAYRARIAFSDFANLLPDNSTQLLNKGISVQNHSYGVGVENYYGIEAAAYDKQTFEHPQLLHVFSSGNSGNKTSEVGRYANIAGMANLTGQFKNSKNTLSVGALESDGTVGILSSKGPANDGRVKPELVAYGKGGTSEAAAVVSGTALLVQQAYATLHGGVLPPAALVKAALINSADDVGRPAVDFESGFGNTDALGAVQAIQQQHFFTSTISNGQEKKFSVAVPEGATMLKVTLVWHEAEASPAAGLALINDLDLSVRNASSGKTWKPWILNTFPHPDSLKLPARRGTDRTNNVEQVTVAVPAGSTYELVVQGFKIPQGSQEFSIVYEYKTRTEWLYPASNTSLQAAQSYKISWQTNKQESQTNLEYRYSTEQKWRLIKQNISLTASSFAWETPDTTATLQLRLISGAEITESEPFTVTELLKLKVGFYCDDQVMVHWSSLPNVANYQLYKMGEMYLEPLQTISDTLVVLSKDAFQDLSPQIAVAPIIQDGLGRRSSTVSADQVGVGCYIKSFLPEQLVLNQALLQLEVSTLYDLAKVTLERKTKDGYQAISSLSPTRLAYELEDPDPVRGKNIYRVKLTTNSGKIYYSHEEEIIYADDKYVLVYPNPVVAGEPLSVVVASASSQIQLYDMTGKLMYATEEASVIKYIPTNNLAKGLYIVRVFTEEGSYLSKRIIIL